MGQNISYDFEGGHIHEPGFLQKKTYVPWSKYGTWSIFIHPIIGIQT